MLVAALGATVSAAAIGLIAVTLVVLLVWTADSRSGSTAAAALRFAGAGWLIAQGAGLSVGGVGVGLLPLGLTALPAVLLFRAGTVLGRTVAAPTLADAGRATAMLAGSYGIIGAVVAALASHGPIHVSPLRALLTTALLAALAGGTGILRSSGLLPDLADLLPGWVRSALVGALVVAAVMLAAGALLTAVSLAVSAGRARELVGSLQTGNVGGLALLLLSVAFVPNMAIFGSSYVLGPGFAIGAGTSVSLTGTHLGPVPALPLLAALPESTSVTPALWALLAVPVLGGVLAGVVVGRRAVNAPLNEVLLTAVGAVVAAGLGLGLLALLAGGPVGTGQLATVGPSSWQVLVAVVGEAVLPALAAAWYTVYRAERVKD